MLFFRGFPEHRFLQRCSFVLLVILFSVTASISAYAAQVDYDTANRAAQNFLLHLRADNALISGSVLEYEEQKVAYLFTLSPSGYILIAAYDEKVPVKGYSLTSNYANLPVAYTENLLKELLPSPTSQKRIESSPETRPNTSYWDYLLLSSDETLQMNYIPDTILVQTKWGQGYPYNKLNPLDGGDRSVTGCVQTALAQIMRYYKHPAVGNGAFTHSWNGELLRASMNRPFNWNQMPLTVTSATPTHQQDEVAALMRDLGIFNKAQFGANSTSTSFTLSYFERAFGYQQIRVQKLVDPATPYDDSEKFFNILRNEINSSRPVLLSMPNHLTIADGYASDPTGRKIHVNMGWEGAFDNYYYLDQTIYAGGNTFAPNHHILYNIKPCSGSSCASPYPIGTSSLRPVFTTPTPDHAISGVTQVRIDAMDPDGKSLAISASPLCQDLQTSVSGNLLTLTPTRPNLYCQVDIRAQSENGVAVDSFNVLSLQSAIAAGEEFTLPGTIFSQSDYDQFAVFLSGPTTITSSITLFTSVRNNSGSTVVAPTNGRISTTFSPGFYTIHTALSSPNHNFRYLYQTAYNNYRLSVTSAASVADMAAALGLSQPVCTVQSRVTVEELGTVYLEPSGQECTTNCSTAVVCGSNLLMEATASSGSLFTGWDGACTGTSATTEFTATDTAICTARFTEDVDRDNMADDWERLYGLDTTRNDGAEDLDGDGFTNLQEYQNGSLPILLTGDLDWDDTISLKDALLALKIVTGMTADTLEVSADAAITDTTPLGLSEAIYCLQKVAEQ